MVWRILALLVILAAGAGWYLTEPDRVAAEDLPPHEPDLENGARIFAIGGCASCHAAPEAEDKTILAGGLRLDTEFGVFAVPNISPGPAGIGGWTAAEFVSAMRHGTSPEGGHYYPAFPYTSYVRMTDADLLDLFAHIGTLPVSDRANDPHELPFPFSVSRGIGLWKLVNLSPEPVLAEPASEQIARGRYLVEGPGHCTECHTPRDWTGGLDAARWLAGAPNPDGEGTIPNITPGALDWSEGDIAYYLESGFTPDFDSVGGSMVAVVENTAKLPPADREAIAAYLKAVPAIE